MKTGLYFLFGIIAAMSFANCANGKQLQEKPPLNLQQTYYTTWVGGTKGAGSGLNLFIPVIPAQDAEIELDSVYFRGKSAELQTKPEDGNLYIAYFKTSDNSRKAPDLVMSSDPNEEYGNQPPEIIGNFPFNLEHNEAVISFRKNGKRDYYKINVVEKDNNGEVKIKYPENIQH